jgi:cyclomaltodextrinase
MKRSLKIFISFSVVTILMVRCSETPPTKNSKVISVEGDGWSKWGPTLPVRLNTSRDLILRDYLLSGEELTHAIWHPSSAQSEELAMSNDSLLTVQIPTPPANGIGYLTLHLNNQTRDIPVFASEFKNVEIRTSGIRLNDASQVYLTGSMNGWSSWETPMHKMEDGVFSTSLSLPIGDHPYQIITDGSWGLDPSNSDSIPNGMGGWNSVISIKESTPPPSIQVTYRENKTLQVEGDVDVRVWCFYDDRFIAELSLTESGQATLPLPAHNTSLHRSHLRLFPVKNGTRGPEVLIPLSQGAPIISTEDLDRRDWHSMVMYFLMVDRFKNGMPSNDAAVNDSDIHPIANHKGGDIIGIALKLTEGYFNRLGINTVWLSPITENAKGAWGLWEDPRTDISSKFSSYHGYWPISNTRIDPAFGTRAEFNGFVDLAHSSDMNVILDYVSNHVHENHPAILNNPEWATDLILPDGSMNTERWDDHRLTTWFDTFLPTLDLSNPEVYSAMSDSAMWWVKNSGIDGFRHDATKHIPEVFWRTLTSKMKRANREMDRRLFQIGETYGSPELIKSYISSGMLDAQFDFNHYDAAVAAIAFENGSFKNLAASARESLKAYGAHNLMGNITGNQDRIRFTSLADGGVVPEGNGKYEGWTQNIQHVENGQGFEKMRILMAYLMAMPGIPCIYYGDEIADVGGNDPDNRREMRFEDLTLEEGATLSWTSEWIKTRRTRMSLLYGSCDLVTQSDDVLIITRSYLSEVSVVIINKSDKTVSIPVDFALTKLAGKGNIGTDGVVTLPELSAICLGSK